MIKEVHTSAKLEDLKIAQPSVDQEHLPAILGTEFVIRFYRLLKGASLYDRNNTVINRLIQEITREPFSGSGKPEPLKHGLSGYWSRRINDEHRIVYRVSEDAALIAQLRYHY